MATARPMFNLKSLNAARSILARAGFNYLTRQGKTHIIQENYCLLPISWTSSEGNSVPLERTDYPYAQSVAFSMHAAPAALQRHGDMLGELRQSQEGIG